MSYEAAYNPSDPTVPNIVTAWSPVDAPTHNPNTVNNPDISALGTDNQAILPVGISKVSGTTLVLLTAQELSALAAAQATALNLAQRAAAVADVSSPSDLGKLQRSVVDVLLTDRNNLVAWMIQTNVNIAAASSLLNLQTRQSSNPAPSLTTLSAVKTAIINDENSGNVD